MAGASQQTLGIRSAVNPIIAQQHPALVDPAERPSGPGYWAFISNESRELANLNFAGQDGFGLGDVGTVTADDIWEVRQRYRDLVRRGEHPDNPTDDINIVWVRDGDQEMKDEDLEMIDEDPDETDDESEKPMPVAQEADKGFGVDLHTGLAHDPSNGGINSQIDPNAVYATRMIKNRRITLDLARAEPNGRSQPHRSWIYIKSGKWIQYTKISKLDWSKKKDVEALNRWRESQRRRNGWPVGRRVRIPYSSGQIAWLNAVLEENGGKRPGKNFDLVAKFNKEFGLEGDVARKASGLERVVSRLLEGGGKRRGGKNGVDKEGDEVAVKKEEDEGGDGGLP